MEISDNGINLIKTFEGLELEAYQCSGNVWTIGWGSTELYGVRVKRGDVITPREAEELLRFDIKKFEYLVNTRINTTITQNQFDALVSHAYNTGGSDTLFELINANEKEKKIRHWFENTYITSRGIFLRGLKNRRILEANLFFSVDV